MKSCDVAVIIFLLLLPLSFVCFLVLCHTRTQARFKKYCRLLTTGGLISRDAHYSFTPVTYINDLFQFASYFDRGVRAVGLYWRCVFISFLLYEPNVEKARERIVIWTRTCRRKSWIHHCLKTVRLKFWLACCIFVRYVYVVARLIDVRYLLF